MKRDREKAEYLTDEFTRFVDANKGWHDDLEMYLKAIMGGDDMWDPDVLDRMKRQRLPRITENLMQRNLRIHMNNYLENARDWKWDGDNSNLDAPIELANLYHRHVNFINKTHIVDLSVFFYAALLQSGWEYYWIMGEDGQREIGVRKLSMLGTYPDPHCDELDWGGPKASKLKFAKWATPETIVDLWPDAADELKDELKYIKEHGYTYQGTNNVVRDRIGDFFDSWSGMLKIIESWYYTSETVKMAIDLTDMQEAPEVPLNDKKKLREFMQMNSMNQERYHIVEKPYQKMLNKTIHCPIALHGYLLTDEFHEIQAKMANGQKRMPVVPVTILEVGEQAKGLVKDALPLNRIRNSFLTTSVMIAASNASNNDFIAPKAFIDDDEAQRYEDEKAMHGRTFRFKLQYFLRNLLPKKQEPNRMDPESTKIYSDMEPAVRNAMLTPEVTQGIKEKGDEPLGSFIRRRNDAFSALTPSMENWDNAMTVRADVEWWMIQVLGQENIERIIDSGPDSKVYPGKRPVVVNQVLDNGQQINRLSDIPRGRAVVVKTAFTSTQRDEILATSIEIKDMFTDPLEAQVLKKIVVQNSPYPREQKEELIAAVEKVQANLEAQMAPEPPVPGMELPLPGKGGLYDAVLPPGAAPIPPPPSQQGSPGQAAAAPATGEVLPPGAAPLVPPPGGATQGGK